MIRLRKVQDGAPFLKRVMLKLAPLMIGAKPPDVLRVLFYRAEFFGKYCGKWHQEVLRGPSEWSVGERELFAAMVSVKNACRFCAGTHAAIANRALGNTQVQQVIDDPEHAPISDKARVALPFVELLTLSPERVGPDDVEPLRAAGISDEAIVDVIHICAIFSMMNRLVDALGIEPMEAKQLAAVAKLLHEKGYEM